ncbi:Stp1/IreP family PP2C-type Ser/Thr phosphatase [Desulfococcus sp.]|uniref:Stp1/IreP family PP2C-type Ser/Thr phosphatase n=1 Tax=Desulfococcus sp. TaxID=2025834 RepID=UPI0035934C04
MPDIAFSGQTDVGLKRTNNEDVFLIRSDLKFCLVADGMGGAAAGELASRYFAETCFKVFSGRRADSIPAVLLLVQKSFQVANKYILDHVREEPRHKGMGCTAELMAFCNGGFVLGHVGDSRTYRFRNGELKQLTRDHSLVQNMVDQGMISADQARRHSHRNVILRAVGIEKNLHLDLIRGKSLPGDIYLLCSDGLTDMVEDAEITAALAADTLLPQKADACISLAKQAGGSDNITVVLSRIS